MILALEYCFETLTILLHSKIKLFSLCVTQFSCRNQNEKLFTHSFIDQSMKISSNLLNISKCVTPHEGLEIQLEYSGSIADIY